jgi:hypothetical protein
MFGESAKSTSADSEHFLANTLTLAIHLFGSRTKDAENVLRHCQGHFSLA